MTKLNLNQMENLNGGLCILNTQTGECRPSVCTGLGIAYDVSSGIGLPLVACVA